MYRVIEALCAVVGGTPVGTNFGLMHLLWMLVSGRLMASHLHDRLLQQIVATARQSVARKRP